MEYSPAQSAIAANIQALRICERDYNKAQAEADKWENLYQRALKAKSDDSVIKDLEFYRDIHAKKAQNLKAMLDEQKQRLDNVKRKFTTINVKPLEDKSKQIESKTQPLSINYDEHLGTRLRKIESDLEEMKAQLIKQQTATEQMLKLNATALSEVRELIEQNCPKKVENCHLSVEKQFEALLIDSDPDDELMLLKVQLRASSTNEITTNSSSTSPSNSAFDKDLEELKRQMDQL